MRVSKMKGRKDGANGKKKDQIVCVLAFKEKVGNKDHDLLCIAPQVAL